MIVRFSEQVVNGFKIQSFTLSEGEIVVIQFPDGPYFYPASLGMIRLLEAFNSKTTNSGTPLTYVEHIKEKSVYRRFFPLTVGAYQKKYANKANPVYKTIYDIKWMTPKIKVCTLAGTPRRKLTLYTALSRTNNIIFDLVGVDPQGGQEIYAIVKAVVNAGGSAILLDTCDEFKNACTTFIKAEYIGS
jgi:hypothetical protein